MTESDPVYIANDSGVTSDAKDIPDAVRREVLERDNYQCQACGITRDLHLHHWDRYRSLGGKHVSRNLVTVCFECHERIHGGEFDIVLIEWQPGQWAAFVVGRHGRGKRGTEIR